MSAYMEEVNGQGMERLEVWVSGSCVDTGWRRQAVWRCALCHLCCSIRTALSAVSDTRATRKRAWTYTDAREPPIGTHLVLQGTKLARFIIRLQPGTRCSPTPVPAAQTPVSDSSNHIHVLYRKQSSANPMHTLCSPDSRCPMEIPYPCP